MATRECTELLRTWHRNKLEHEIQNYEVLLQSNYLETSIDGKMNVCIELLKIYSEELKKLCCEYIKSLKESEYVGGLDAVNKDYGLCQKAMDCRLQLLSYREKLMQQKSLPDPIEPNVIQQILGALPWLSIYDKENIIQTRCQLSDEWKGFLKNATVTIKLSEGRVIVRKAGTGTNKLVVQRNSNGEIDCDWEEKGIGMKLRNGARVVGQFFSSMFSSFLRAIGLLDNTPVGR